MRCKRIGLTGGIGSGKSTVAFILQHLGFGLVDIDAIAHTLTQPGGVAMPQIVQVFGPTYQLASGALDRVHMRQTVFQKPQAKAQLEAILHPLIRTECWRQVQACTQSQVILEIPLLVESGEYWRSHLDMVWVVDCPVHTQVLRVQNRSGWSAEQVHAVMAQQASRAQRLACADAIFSNEEDVALEVLQEKIASFVQSLGLKAL